MRLIYLIVSLEVICLAISKSTEYAEIGDNVITYFGRSPILGGVKNILRSEIEDSDDISTPNAAANSYESSEKSSNMYKRKKPVNRYLISANPVRKRPVLEYKLDMAMQRSIDDMKDIKKAADKARILKKAKANENLLNDEKEFNYPRADDGATGAARYHMDPLLNMLRSGQYRKNFRRKDKSEGESDSSVSGSDTGKLNWKEEWKRLWRYKKYEALNSSLPAGDHVNIIAARPWGIPCGDPNQHDMPWGNCMLAVECEAEYRIYRGDFFCGRSQFVCCGLQVISYDLYQGIDVSFDDKSLSTDSEERKQGGKSDSNKSKKKKQEEKRRRRKEREKRKNKIKNKISQIVTEIRRILNKAYKNGTKEKKRKTKLLKQFVKHLKSQYKKDRQSVKEIHEERIVVIDAALMTRLNQIQAVNEQFMNNRTFADIIINGRVTETGVRMLVEAYPELSAYFTQRRSEANDKYRKGKKRRSNKKQLKDYLDYDIEYGFKYN